MQNWGSEGINFITILILARLLNPEDFGLVSLTSVFVSFAQVFVDQGMSDAIVQRDELSKEHLDTAFWTGMFMGGVIAMLTFSLSGFIAVIFSEPQVGAILRWLSIGFLISGLSSTQQAILHRKLAFKSLAIRTLVAQVVGGASGVTLALLGFGVWSLVAQSLMIGVAGAVVLWRVSDWRPGFRFSKRHFKELFSFGLNIVGNKLLKFANQRSDKLIIGYFLGTTMLGYYSLAYRQLRMLISILTSATSAVAYPVFSRIQKQPKRVRKGFYTATQYASLLAIPTFVGVAVVAPELVITLFGEKWIPSIPVIRILSFMGILKSVFISNAAIIKSAGKPSWLFGLNLLNAIVNVTAFLIVVRWGIVAVAASFVILGYLLAPLRIWVVKRLIAINIRIYLRQYIEPIIGAAVLALVVMGLKLIFHRAIGPQLQLISFVSVGIVTYLGIIYFMRPYLLTQMMEFARLALPKWFTKKI